MHSSLLLSFSPCLINLVLFVKHQCLKAVKTQLWLLPFCAQQSVSVISWTRNECLTKTLSQANHCQFCSLLVKSKPPWLCHEAQKSSNLKQKKHFYCITIDKTKDEAYKQRYLHISDIFRPTCISTLVSL